MYCRTVHNKLRQNDNKNSMNTYSTVQYVTYSTICTVYVLVFGQWNGIVSAEASEWHTSVLYTRRGTAPINEVNALIKFAMACFCCSFSSKSANYCNLCCLIVDYYCTVHTSISLHIQRISRNVFKEPLQILCVHCCPQPIPIHRLFASVCMQLYSKNK